ncbi:MAG: DUF362 domain-containing protein [Promethearchaeota archaeon]
MKNLKNSNELKNNVVYIKKLKSEHQKESFTKYKPLNKEVVEEINEEIYKMFDFFGGSNLLKSSGNVFIKPNGIDAKPYCFTRAEVLESVIKYWRENGAKNIYVIENSTQANYTRLVFEVTGYKKICKKYKAKPVYLDEDKIVSLKFKLKPSSKEEPDGYDSEIFRTSKTVLEELIKKANENLYINLPKLKTHSMGVVTLGIKNQWAFPIHADRRVDHNYNLHYKFIDVLKYIKPDFTLIEGIEGTIHGHYPPTSLADKLVKPFKLLIGGKNVVAVDIIGASVFGIKAEEVPSIKLAIDMNLSGGIKSIDDIEIIGDKIELNMRMPHDLIQDFHPDVKIIKGKDLLCAEGCKNNPLTLLQVLRYDFNAKGGWNLVIGKGHDLNVIDSLKGPVLIAGHCAIEEVSERLIKRLGKKNVYLSGYCNDLAATTSSMVRLGKVNIFKMVKLNPLKSMLILALVKLKKSHANVPSIFSNIIKQT